MTVRIHFDDLSRTLFVTADGTVTDEEVRDFARRAVQSPEFPPGGRELIDLRGIERLAVSTDVLREMAQAFRAADTPQSETRIAIVASTDVAYGLSRMYQAFRDDSAVELEVFRDLAEARTWLGLPPAEEND
jgi:hypothetical protein